MNNIDYQKLLESLRQLYREGKFKELKNRYLLSSWLISPEDRKKIEEVIGVQYVKEGKQDELIQYAVEVMGCKIVDK